MNCQQHLQSLSIMIQFEHNWKVMILLRLKYRVIAMRICNLLKYVRFYLIRAHASRVYVCAPHLRQRIPLNRKTK